MKNTKKRTPDGTYMRYLAEKYEKGGFLIEAVDAFRYFRPQKAKSLHLEMARKAEKMGLFIIAAKSYEAAGQPARSRRMWVLEKRQAAKWGAKKIEREVEKMLKPEDPRREQVRNVVFEALRFENAGSFRQAQKAWLKAAKCFESMSEYGAAAKDYFRGGNIRKAEQCWKKAHKSMAN